MKRGKANEFDTRDRLEISSAFSQHIKAVLNISESSTSDSTYRTELDSHADYPVVGKNANILYKTKMTLNVTPFSDDFGMMPEVSVVHFHNFVNIRKIHLPITFLLLRND